MQDQNFVGYPKGVTMSDPLDRVVIACNYSVTTNIAIRGAKAYIVLPNPGNDNKRIVLLVRSRSGRWVRKWENIRILNNFRLKTLPPEHHMYFDERIWDSDSAALIAKLIDSRSRFVR